VNRSQLNEILALQIQKFVYSSLRKDKPIESKTFLQLQCWSPTRSSRFQTPAPPACSSAAAQPAAQPAVQSPAQPAAQPATQPAAQPAAPGAVQPALQPAAQPTAAQPAAQPQKKSGAATVGDKK
jgi:hypothetical protein